MTVPTVGPDGAYLVITRARAGEQQGDSPSFVALLKTAAFRAVTYRDGHTCRPMAVQPCARIGLVPAKARHFTQAALASPITATRWTTRVASRGWISRASEPAELRYASRAEAGSWWP